jgi:hypothetical protein
MFFSGILTCVSPDVDPPMWSNPFFWRLFIEQINIFAHFFTRQTKFLSKNQPQIFVFQALPRFSAGANSRGTPRTAKRGTR